MHDKQEDGKGRRESAPKGGEPRGRDNTERAAETTEGAGTVRFELNTPDASLKLGDTR